jgi:hypothetical protein
MRKFLAAILFISFNVQAGSSWKVVDGEYGRIFYKVLSRNNDRVIVKEKTIEIDGYSAATFTVTIDCKEWIIYPQYNPKADILPGTYADHIARDVCS